jgi:hypothetical protein
MQRKLHILCFALLMIFSFSRTQAQCKKSEVALGYGYYSFYSFVNHGMNDAPYSTSSGSFALTYRYYVSRQVTIGLGLGYEDISSWGSFFTIAPEVTVAYLDTRNDQVRVRLYGSVSAGVSVLTDNVVGLGEADESGLKPWAFQATPIGMRIGRQFAGFIELGLGYKGLIHGGIEVRFPRVLHVHEKVD